MRTVHSRLGRRPHPAGGWWTPPPRPSLVEVEQAESEVAAGKISAAEAARWALARLDPGISEEAPEDVTFAPARLAAASEVGILGYSEEYIPSGVIAGHWPHATPAGPIPRRRRSLYSPHPMQNDPMHPAFSPRPPPWVSLAKGAVGVLILLGLVIYALVR